MSYASYPPYYCQFIMEISTDDHCKLATPRAGTNLRVFRIAPKLSLRCRLTLILYWPGLPPQYTPYTGSTLMRQLPSTSILNPSGTVYTIEPPTHARQGVLKERT